MGQIKILTGWSHIGGSTTALINLTNLFNKAGYSAVLCGPHNYHVGKCESNYLKNVRIRPDDIVIAHFLPHLKSKPKVKKLVLTVHEKEMMKLKNISHNIYDKIHFLNKEQYQWHGVDCPHFICGNPHEDLKKSEIKPEKIAGVIGSIDKNKQTHVSIERALKDGMNEINLYGNIHDQDYFQVFVQPLIKKHPNKIKLIGYVDDKQNMYNSVSDVYLSSQSENASLVADECILTGVKFHGNDNIIVPKKILTNDQVLKKWVKELGL